jgi:hypothetical protein
MKADVYLYDSACHVLAQPLSITAFDVRGTALDRQVAAQLGNEWGARLAWGRRTVPNVFEITIDDTSRQPRFAPFHAGDLNGDPGVRVDAVLYPVPPPASGSGTAPTSFGGISPYIARQARWTEPQKAGARRLVEVYAHLAELDTRDVEEMIERWSRILDGVGIPPEVVSLKQNLAVPG